MTVHSLKMAAAGDDAELDAPRITFETAWEKYPRKVARKDAMKAWAKISPADYLEIMSGIERARKTEDWRKDGGKFIPYFSTWLNGERWTDELEADLTMGMCKWNVNGNREPGKPQCAKAATKEKNGVVYCTEHGARVNG